MDTLEASRARIRERLSQLRTVLAAHQLAGIMVPSSDPHLSEYLPEHWHAREWLSGFTGSVGTLIVTSEFAGLWVDSRYWVQAESQLAGTSIQVMKVGGVTSTAHLDWLAEHLPRGARFAVDGNVLGVSAARALEQALRARSVAVQFDADVVALIWADRAALPKTAVVEHASPYAPATRAEKLAQLRQRMAELGADWHFVSTLDDIAWIFNLRGADVSYNPVFVAHALIGTSGATLFIASGKIDAALTGRLAADGVVLADYSQARSALGALPSGATLLIDPRRVTLGQFNAIAPGVRIVEAINPSTLAKSRKSAAEAEFVRAAMREDGAALAEFFCWLEDNLGRETITELTIDEKITAARARRTGFVSPSFGTIAAFNANGAMPHYRASVASHATIAGDGLLLIDSGGQYLFGTTDITRMLAIGTPSALQRRDCTLVLKGMIALASARFPRGTRSPYLDALARAPIWADGIDYGHGTGHGVGYFLNVHEGPQSISPHALPEVHTGMEPGMITSDEPGIYRPGKWGVRIENLLLAVPWQSGEFGEFLAFETLTLCPIDTRCLETSLLTKTERDWLNGYHAQVLRDVGPLLSGAPLEWLRQRCAAV